MIEASIISGMENSAHIKDTAFDMRRDIPLVANSVSHLIPIMAHRRVIRSAVLLRRLPYELSNVALIFLKLFLMDFWNDKILNMSDRRSIPNDRSSILKNPWDIEQEAPLDLSCRGTGAKYCGVLPLKCPRRLPCQTCGKNFDRPSLLKRHLRTHTGEKPHGCSVCGKMFSTSSSLNTHARIHTGERPHECPICGKRFTASSNLYYHRMTHYKEKPHKCNECRRSFPTPGDLRAHGYSHTGDWPLRCPICTRGFCKPAALRHHIQLHSGDRPYHCKMCNKKFSVASNLRAHERMHCSESTDLHSNDCGDIQSDKWLVHDINYEPKGRITLHVPAPILPWTHWLPYSK